MVSLIVIYPASNGTTFDWDYYSGPHVALAKRLLEPRGMVRIEIGRGVSGLPGTPAPYYAVANLYFATSQQLQSALGETANELIADEKKYYNGESVVQVNEIVDTMAR